MTREKEESKAPCPVCMEVVKVQDFEEHTQSHVGVSDVSEEPDINSGDSEDNSEKVPCPLGCGQQLSRKQVPAHEAAHGCVCTILGSSPEGCETDSSCPLLKL